MSDLVTGIDDLAAEIGTQMAATRDLANGLSVTAEKVRDGVDASLDIGTILDRLTALVTELATDTALANKIAAGINNATDVDGLVTNIGTLATNSIAPVSGRLPVDAGITASLTTIINRLPTNSKAFQIDWVERIDTGEQLLRIATMTEAGAIAPYLFMRDNGQVDVSPGPVRLAAPGRTMAPATSWAAAASDSEWHRRFYRLMFPGGITRSTVTTAAIGAYTLTAIPAGQRIVITRVILQLLSGSPAVTVLLRSVGASPTTEGSYRLVIEGDAVLDPLHPATYIRLTTGHNIGLDISVASGVYCQFYWYAEDPATGLPITA
jgi:hypothetical protein